MARPRAPTSTCRSAVSRHPDSVPTNRVERPGTSTRRSSPSTRTSEGAASAGSSARAVPSCAPRPRDSRTEYAPVIRIAAIDGDGRPLTAVTATRSADSYRRALDVGDGDVDGAAASALDPDLERHLDLVHRGGEDVAARRA